MKKKTLIILAALTLVAAAIAHGDEEHIVKPAAHELNWLLIHLHPKLVHLPIGLIFGAALIELLALILKRDSFAAASRIVFGLGILTALAALGSGFVADSALGHGYSAHEQAHTHRNWMILATATWSVLWVALKYVAIFRQTGRIYFFAALLFICGLFAYGAHIGGGLVYEHGVGVKAAQKKPASQ